MREGLQLRSERWHWVPGALPWGVVALCSVPPHTVYPPAKPLTLHAWPGLQEPSEEAGRGRGQDQLALLPCGMAAHWRPAGKYRLRSLRKRVQIG